MTSKDEEDSYAWEGGFEKTWEAIEEDEKGSIGASIERLVLQSRRQRQELQSKRRRLGIMRHLFVILDTSLPEMNDPDLKPTRLICSIELLNRFIKEFFENNPISQLGIISTCNKKAHMICQLTGNIKQLQAKLLPLKSAYTNTECPSIQNSLEMAYNTLCHLPAHSSREILLIICNFSTCDPGKIQDTIDKLKNSKIRCFVFSLSAETHLLNTIAEQTNGTSHVILNELHFHELLNSLTRPVSISNENTAALIKMAFPVYEEHADKMHMCIGHLVDGVCVNRFGGGYFCPNCKSKYCSLPIECRICGLTLVSGAHIARSYHYLFPMSAFNENVIEKTDEECFGCGEKFKVSQVCFSCSKCHMKFCCDCDQSLHNYVFSCPGCLSPSSSSETSQYRT